ncbi:histidine phosphatase family protein [Lacticaseibacillus pantheris]|uniref:Phosphoglycerate mutase family protein n=1 Tax=Lacticaseibacillus pantheris DSM 15945 = JCM 12539 = NBRC 106106 TaxID=1423783 RepID=A0A0R1TWK4_9LACO|nr:histidine phosphatase family protein [Lacticaseibacillus pantheris]KRL85574.1 phosphoglycerate mutase family protein [Lacticaseibacillus pantheris DSM 15945 = JCM 12539 = NBRC 106106]
MTKLYFVRHGKTEWNLEGRYQGAFGDSPLLPESYVQVHALASYLNQEHVHFDHAYVSPLKRTRTTALELLTHLDQPDIPLTILPALREFNLGLMEGQSFTDVAARFPNELHAFRHAPADYDPSALHGETFDQLLDRMTPPIQEIVANDYMGSANYLFVGHGASLAALIQHLVGTPVADLRKDGGLTNSSLTTVQADGPALPYHMVQWNDTHFLPGTRSATDTI